QAPRAARRLRLGARAARRRARPRGAPGGAARAGVRRDRPDRPSRRAGLRGPGYAWVVTASLPEDIQQVFSRFVTTEYTTIDARGHPITWPVTPYYRPGAGAID